MKGQISRARSISLERGDRMVRYSSAAFAALAFFALSAARAQPFSDPRAERNAAIASSDFLAQPHDPACSSERLTSTGGPGPQNPHTLVVRWTGFSNFELTYKGKVILLDAYFDRGKNYPPLGFSAADVKKADAIIIGHGHYDHMSDAASVGMRTGATLVGAALTTDVLKSESVPESQIRTVTGKGGELLNFEGFTVQPILALHGEPDKHVTQVMEGAYNSLLPKPSADDEAEEKAIRARGTFDPRLVTEGTIAYLITLDDGFRIMYRDSGGHVTDYEKAAMQKIAGVDLAIVALSADILNVPTEQQALEHASIYRPDVFMPAHHDGALRGHMPLWRATEPVFQALKDQDPNLVTVSRGYREPTCFNTEINIANGRKR
jgi:L-ascorbate metabolism protein UlaG (beta-lactamase superfamily)